MEVKGRVYNVGPIETRDYGDKTYYSRELVIDATRFDPYTGGAGKASFPQFTVNGEERCRELDLLSKGEKINITFFLDGVKYDKDGQEKFWTKLIAYKVESLGKGPGVQETAQERPPMERYQTTEEPAPTEDDLPF